MKRNVNIKAEKASYEAYLYDIFVNAVNTQGTSQKNVDKILHHDALSYERAVVYAKEDVKCIINVRSAVSILLKSVSVAQNKSP